MATPRGSHIVGYTVRCTHGSSVVLGTGHGSPVAVTGLRGGVPYSCQTKARSKAGAGQWSAAVTMPAHVGG